MLRNDFTIPSWYVKSPLGDWTLYMLAIKNRKIKKLNDVMAVYRVHDQSVWSLKTSEYRILNTIKSIELLINDKDITPKIKAVLKLTAVDLKRKLPKKSNKIKLFLKKIKSILNG